MDLELRLGLLTPMDPPREVVRCRKAHAEHVNLAPRDWFEKGENKMDMASSVRKLTKKLGLYITLLLYRLIAETLKKSHELSSFLADCRRLSLAGASLSLYPLASASRN